MQLMKIIQNKSISFETLKLCLESIAHLTMHFEVKVLFSNILSWLSFLFAIVPSYGKDGKSFDTVVLYSILQIICNMTTSCKELESTNEVLFQTFNKFIF